MATISPHGFTLQYRDQTASGSHFYGAPCGASILFQHWPGGTRAARVGSTRPGYTLSDKTTAALVAAAIRDGIIPVISDPKETPCTR